MRQRTHVIFALVLVVATGAFLGPAVAETRRIAVVAANNSGNQESVPLRFAETDAGKVARVFVELGGVSPDRLFLLQGRRVADIRQALQAAKAQTDQWHAQPDIRVVFLFYFSGHSDGVAMEVGAERLPFSELKEWVATCGADVRLIIVDTCKSGSLLKSKGGARAEPFEIQIADDLPKTGEAVITSSAGNETSLESTELRGSFFTHHLVSGLRGAADSSGDGQVSLAEAYDYAFVHTTSATANTLAGTQHPSYDYRLSGQGELVLTEFRTRSAGLTVPDGYQRILVTQLLRDQVVAELTTGARMRLALPPGAYSLRAWRAGKPFFTRVVLADGEDRVVSESDLLGPTPLNVSRKGGPALRDGADAAAADSPRLSASLGLTGGIAEHLSVMTSGRIQLRAHQITGVIATIEGAFGTGQGFSENRALALVGYRMGTAWRDLSGFLGLQAGAGLVGQSVDHDHVFSGWLGCAPFAGAELKINRSLALVLETELQLGLFRRDRALRASTWPAGFWV